MKQDAIKLAIEKLVQSQRYDGLTAAGMVDEVIDALRSMGDVVCVPRVQSLKMVRAGAAEIERCVEHSYNIQAENAFAAMIAAAGNANDE